MILLLKVVEAKFKLMDIPYTTEMLDGVVGAISAMFSGFCSEYVFRNDILKQPDSLIEVHLASAFKIINLGLNQYSSE